MNIKQLFLSLLTAIAMVTAARGQSTFCNPLNLNYRFAVGTGEGSSFREAADPMIILYKDKYYLFASHSGGYWISDDMLNWDYIVPTGLDIDRYAPTAFNYKGDLYFTCSESGAIYKADDPETGVWHQVAPNPHEWNDPWVFVDDDDRVYAYWGSSERGNIYCAELDPNDNFKPLTDDIVCIKTNTGQNGFERMGENNDGNAPWTEGAAMLKYNGKYYLTYATPATQQRTYCDGYYVADSPTGPFTRGANTPTTRKVSGFVTGTGHGGLFFDKLGRLWSTDCVTLSLKHWFERRVGIFPAYIDADGLLHTDMSVADYPLLVPALRTDTQAAKGWSLLSYGKTATASSTLDNDHAPSKAVDEDMRTYWSAKTGNAGEWFQIDLGHECTVNVVQVNYYESGTTYASGRDSIFPTRYIIEGSNDGSSWTTLVDKSHTDQELDHDYNELATPASVRYVRITTKAAAPGYGKFALMGLRVFGSGDGVKPSAVKSLEVTRSTDRADATAKWSAADNADGYINMALLPTSFTIHT